MGRKCSVSNCNTGFATCTYKGSVFSFPHEGTDEREAWRNALPNKLLTITNDMGVCDLHWPPGHRTKKVKRWIVPDEPPSVFPGVPNSCLQQTAPRKRRSIEERGISQSARNERDELHNQLISDNANCIGDWKSFVDYCKRLDLVRMENDTNINLMTMSKDLPPEVLTCIEISHDFKVACYVKSTKVNVRSLINSFSNKLETYSQLDSIISFLSETSSSPTDEIKVCAAKVMEISNVMDDPEKAQHLEMLSTQLELSTHGKNGRRYSPLDYTKAIDIFLRSRSAYKAIRRHLILPNPKSIKHLFGKLETPGSLQECKETVSAVMQRLDDKQKYCKILVDEVHIKPSVRYQGNHLIGYSIDQPDKPARTILALMICPLLGGKSFVARLIPVYTINADILYDQILKLIHIIHEVSGSVFMVMTDNLRANTKCFNLFHEQFGSLNEFSIKHPVENDNFDRMYLLFDPVHLFKNIKNNWLTEKLRKLKFYVPGKNESVIAEWNHVVQIYKREKDLCVKETNLDFATIYPTNFDKQKVHLTTNVFNEKTTAALKKGGNEDTAIFVENVTRLINILNVKSPNKAVRLHDPDRRVFSSCEDDRFDFLLEMAESFHKMDVKSSRYTHRVMTLTADTSQALVITLKGLVSLIKHLLEKGLPYVMPGEMQSDRLEGEFGAFRQMNGGNYYMSFNHVQNCLKLRRIELFSILEVNEVVWHSTNDCCSKPLSNEDLEILDKVFDRSCKLSEIERSSIYYISGYVCFKEGIRSEEQNQIVGCPESEFTTEVSRGRLCHPTEEIFELGLYLYLFYIKINDKTCINKLLRAFNEIYELTHYTFLNVDSILRRFVNCFSKGFAKKESDTLKASNQEKNIKRKRLER